MKDADAAAPMLPGEPLPFATRLFCAIPLAVYAGFMIGGVAILLGLHFKVRSPQTCRKINGAVAVLSILLFIIYLIAVFMPLTKNPSRLGGS